MTLRSIDFSIQWVYEKCEFFSSKTGCLAGCQIGRVLWSYQVSCQLGALFYLVLPLNFLSIQFQTYITTCFPNTPTCWTICHTVPYIPEFFQVDQNANFNSTVIGQIPGETKKYRPFDQIKSIVQRTPSLWLRPGFDSELFPVRIIEYAERLWWSLLTAINKLSLYVNADGICHRSVPRETFVLVPMASCWLSERS